MRRSESIWGVYIKRKSLFLFKFSSSSHIHLYRYGLAGDSADVV